MEYTTENSIKLMENSIKLAKEEESNESNDQTEAEPLNSPEPLESGKSIPAITDLRRRTDSLQAQLSELKRKENEMKLKLKIVATKEKMAKIQERLDAQAIEDSFYSDIPDKQGYRKLRTEKWERDFETLMIRLKEVEDAEADKTITTEDAIEAKKIITKEIKKLKSIKSQVDTKNKLNKLRRGVQKFFKGTAKVTKEIGKISDGIGQYGGSVGGGGDFGKNTDFESFFKDKPARKTNSTKKKRRKKSGKKRKSRRKSRRKTSTRETQEETSSTPDFFSGI